MPYSLQPFSLINLSFGEFIRWICKAVFRYLRRSMYKVSWFLQKLFSRPFKMKILKLSLSRPSDRSYQCYPYIHHDTSGVVFKAFICHFHTRPSTSLHCLGCCKSLLCNWRIQSNVNLNVSSFDFSSTENFQLWHFKDINCFERESM